MYNSQPTAGYPSKASLLDSSHFQTATSGYVSTPECTQRPALVEAQDLVASIAKDLYATVSDARELADALFGPQPEAQGNNSVRPEGGRVDHLHNAIVELANLTVLMRHQVQRFRAL